MYAYVHQYASKKGRVGDYLGITKIMQRQQQTHTEMVLHDKFMKSRAFLFGITQVKTTTKDGQHTQRERRRHDERRVDGTGGVDDCRGGRGGSGCWHLLIRKQVAASERVVSRPRPR